MKDKKKKILLYIALILTVFGIYSIYQGFNTNTQKAMFNKYVESAEISTYVQFQRDLSDRQVDTVYYNTNNEYLVYTLINDDTAVMTREQRDEYVYPDENYRRTLYTAGESFRQQMISYNVNLVLIRDGITGTIVLQLVISLLPCLMIIFYMMTMLKAQGLGSISEEQLIKTSNVNLDDIIGLDELKDEIQLIIKLLKDSKYGERLGVRLPKGILLSGAPGVGKTMIAKAIAKEADVTFISTAASDFQELFVGNGARHIREIFKVARNHTPCVVFIDEIDAIGTARNKRGSTGEDNQTINALLKEMDGFTENEGIFILAATNHADKLDEAIKRAGRFDREIVIPTPRNWEIRKKLFQNYLKDKPVSDNVDLDTLSRQTTGFTGADIATVCNEAGIVALADDLEFITHECIEEAIDKRVFKGSRSKIKTYDKDKAIVAKHESGHALMSRR
ncbi:MAG: AAA family ATPase [Roseburia sp.]|nr:AAA family ATPase [Roseburia sp.]